MSEEQRAPWLIQRLFWRPDPSEKGIDAFFSFDYMGSAEFEFGTLFRTLSLMRAQEAEYLPEPKRIKDVNGRIAWFIGSETMLELARRVFLDQSYAANQSMDFKESTAMLHAYEPVRDEDKERAPIGWWALDQKLPWLLFTKKDYARQWLAAF